MFPIFLIQHRSFHHKVFSESNFSSSFLLDFLFFLAYLEAPFSQRCLLFLFPPSVLLTILCPMGMSRRKSPTNKKKMNRIILFRRRRTISGVLHQCLDLLDIADYTHEKVYIKLSKTVDLQYTLHNISKKLCKDVVMSMHQQGFSTANE